MRVESVELGTEVNKNTMSFNMSLNFLLLVQKQFLLLFSFSPSLNLPSVISIVICGGGGGSLSSFPSLPPSYSLLAVCWDTSVPRAHPHTHTLLAELGLSLELCVRVSAHRWVTRRTQCTAKWWLGLNTAWKIRPFIRCTDTGLTHNVFSE